MEILRIATATVGTYTHDWCDRIPCSNAQEEKGPAGDKIDHSWADDDLSTSSVNHRQKWMSVL